MFGLRSPVPNLRLLVAGDLHYGVNPGGDRATRALAAFVREQHADAFVIVGDIGADSQQTRACLELFRGFRGLKLALPGNHDVWTTGPGAESSWDRHERLLPDLFRSAGFEPLHLQPVRLGDVTLVGSMGWYDYSFRDNLGLQLDAYRSKTPPWSPGPVWNDARFAHFPWDDPTLNEVLVKRLAQQVEEATGGSGSLVALLHHVPTKALLFHPRCLVPRRWRFANAFLGSERYWETLSCHPGLGLVVCGHIHQARTIRRRKTQLASLGGDYERKELLEATPTRVTRRRRFG